MNRKRNRRTTGKEKRSRLLMVGLFLFFFSVGCIAQNIPESSGKMVSRAYLLGVGHTNLLDTYLSPMAYQGGQISYLGERTRTTRIAGGRVGFQSIFQILGSYTLSPVQNSAMMGGCFLSRNGWHYRWQPVAALCLYAGGSVNLTGGGWYHTRNGNNPAQAKLQLDVAASVAAKWSFRIGHQPLSVRGQVDLLLAGMMFSPNYGQSYYELFSLGHYDHNLCFIYPGNAPTFRQMLTLDIPLRKATLRVGYVSEIEQSRVNGLKNHRYSHSFMIGYVLDLKVLSRKRIPESQIFY